MRFGPVGVAVEVAALAPRRACGAGEFGAVVGTGSDVDVDVVEPPGGNGVVDRPAPEA